MRKLIFSLAICFAFALASPAVADSAVDRALVGLNGVVTAGAGPVMGVVNGDDRLGLPLPMLTDRLVGLFTGSVGGAFQAATGALDLVFSPIHTFVGVPGVSPEPMFNLFADDAAK